MNPFRDWFKRSASTSALDAVQAKTLKDFLSRDPARNASAGLQIISRRLDPVFMGALIPHKAQILRAAERFTQNRPTPITLGSPREPVPDIFTGALIVAALNLHEKGTDCPCSLISQHEDLQSFTAQGQLKPIDRQTLTNNAFNITYACTRCGKALPPRTEMPNAFDEIGKFFFGNAPRNGTYNERR